MRIPVPQRSEEDLPMSTSGRESRMSEANRMRRAQLRPPGADSFAGIAQC